MTARVLLDARAVAERLHRSREWFYKNRANLEARGFPPPVPGCGRRWDPAAIDAWLDRAIAPAPSTADSTTAAGAIDWERRLADRLPALSNQVTGS